MQTERFGISTRVAKSISDDKSYAMTTSKLIEKGRKKFNCPKYFPLHTHTQI